MLQNMGLDDASYTIQSYFFDYDNDGDKDVYFVNHPDDFSKSMRFRQPWKMVKWYYVEDTTTVYVSDRLFENRGGKFIDVTKKAGLIDHAFGLSASIADINGDGWPDIYVPTILISPIFYISITGTELLQINLTNILSMSVFLQWVPISMI